MVKFVFFGKPGMVEFIFFELVIYSSYERFVDKRKKFLDRLDSAHDLKKKSSQYEVRVLL